MVTFHRDDGEAAVHIRAVSVAGPRGRCTAALCRSHGSSRLPESDENQHVFVGEDSQAKLQAKEISYQAPS